MVMQPPAPRSALHRSSTYSGRTGAERPFRLPLGFTITAVVTVLCVLLLTQQPLANLLAALGALAVGLGLYAITRYGAYVTRSSRSVE